jgi:hypothetical protein
MTSVRQTGLRLLAAAFLMTTAGSSATLAAQIAPNRSDGSSGSFNAQFGGRGDLVWFNVDTGQAFSNQSGGYVAFTVPYKIRSWNGQTFHAFNFTDMIVQPSIKLTIYGSAPAMFLAKTNISFAGQFTIASEAGAGGAAPTPSAPSGGTGASRSGAAGGGGGTGPSGETEGQCSGEYFTASGGGGGGNVAHGGPGRPGDYPIDAAGPPPNYPGGKGGKVELQTRLLGGAGGGAGGGGVYGGDFYGFPGANGGGAVVFSSAGTITIAPGAIIDASGSLGASSNSFTGSSGGGAGGDEWFYSVGAFTNSGTLNLAGGAGGTSTYTSGCYKPKTVKGPNGGAGSGGFLQIVAPSITNDGTIKVPNGDGSTGGLVSMIGKVAHSGTIVGADTWAIPK